MRKEGQKSYLTKEVKRRSNGKDNENKDDRS